MPDDGRVPRGLLDAGAVCLIGYTAGGFELRKAISTFVVACAFVAGASGVAEAGATHIKSKRCNTKYTPACAAPKIHSKSLPPQCVSAGPAVKLPTITFVSNAGIKKIQVMLGTRTIKVVTFSGQGKTQYSLKGLMVSTAGLLAGGHNVSVKVTDVTNKTASKSLRFSICQAKPVFTG